VGLVEIDKFAQGVLANNVRVEYEEETAHVLLSDDLLGKTDGASSAKRLVLKGASDLDFVLLLEVLEFSHHDLGLVVHS